MIRYRNKSKCSDNFKECQQEKVSNVSRFPIANEIADHNFVHTFLMQGKANNWSTLGRQLGS